MDSNTWLFVFAGIQALGVVLAFFRVDVRILQIFDKAVSMPLSTRREKFMAILAVGSILFCAVGWSRIDTDLPEFDSPQTDLALGWNAGNGGCSVIANGDKIWPYRNSYKVASGCLLYNGIGDILDAPNLQQGSLYDIRHGQITARAVWGASFPKYMEDNHATGNFCVLMLVPVGIETSQFSTLGQARKLGVKIIFSGLAGSRTGHP
jgi:hypothetical protein